MGCPHHPPSREHDGEVSTYTAPSPLRPSDVSSTSTASSSPRTSARDPALALTSPF